MRKTSIAMIRKSVIYISTRNVKTTRVYMQTAITESSELEGRRDGGPAGLPSWTGRQRMKVEGRQAASPAGAASRRFSGRCRLVGCKDRVTVQPRNSAPKGAFLRQQYTSLEWVVAWQKHGLESKGLLEVRGRNTLLANFWKNEFPKWPCY